MQTNFMDLDVLEELKLQEEINPTVEQSRLTKEYKVFLTTVKGKKWVKERKRNAPSDATAGDFGDYLYDFYPEMLQ